MADRKESDENKSIFYTILPVLLCGLSIPLSIFLWVGNLALTFLTKSSNDREGKSGNKVCLGPEIGFTHFSFVDRKCSYSTNTMAVFDVGADSLDGIRAEEKRC